ncbi:hypothetical protein KHA80_07615 [Anaerobacillus sp. HL2]|nr:hypothetical protein KHA80_07615 [Anaerobacillus sp. HL2]
METLIANMDQILNAAFQLIQGLATGILNALPVLIEALPQIINSIITFITNNLPKIIEMGVQPTIQLAAGLIRAIPQLRSTSARLSYPSSPVLVERFLP